MAITEDMENIPENVPDRFIVSSIIIKNKENNSALLNEAFEFMKLNYNCPDSEKSGTGKGSCTDNMLPEKPIDVIQKYTSDSRIYKIINGSLEMEESQRSPTVQKYITDLSNAINDNRINSKLTVYRGISKKQYEKMINNNELIPGSINTNNRFISTSIDMHVAKNFAEPVSSSDKRIVMQIDLPEDSEAMLVKNKSALVKENEVLINHGSKFQFIKKEETNGNIILHMKYITK